MYLISGRTSSSSLTIAIPTACSTLKQLAAFDRDGYVTVVFDAKGRERSREELLLAADDERRALEEASSFKLNLDGRSMDAPQRSPASLRLMLKNALRRPKIQLIGARHAPRNSR